MKFLDWFNILGGIIGIAAFVWAWILNSEQRKINKHTLREKEDAHIKQQQALIRCEGYKCGSGEWKVRIWNGGLCAAKNIAYESEDINKDNSGVRLLTREGLFPYPLLNSGDSFEVSAILIRGATPTPKIKFIWDDDYGESNEREQILSF